MCHIYIYTHTHLHGPVGSVALCTRDLDLPEPVPWAANFPEQAEDGLTRREHHDLSQRVHVRQNISYIIRNIFWLIQRSCFIYSRMAVSVWHIFGFQSDKKPYCDFGALCRYYNGTWTLWLLAHEGGCDFHRLHQSMVKTHHLNPESLLMTALQ